MPGPFTRATPPQRRPGSFTATLERGFIKAETVAYSDLVACGSVAARARRTLPDGGKEYVVQDDVLLSSSTSNWEDLGRTPVVSRTSPGDAGRIHR